MYRLVAPSVALALLSGPVQAGTLDPVGSEPTLLDQVASLQLDTLGSQLSEAGNERAVWFHEQRRLDSEQNSPALPRYEARVTSRMTGVQARVSDTTRIGVMLADLEGDADFDDADDNLVNHGIGLSGVVRTDYKGLMIDALAGISHLDTALEGASGSGPFAVQANRYVRFFRLQGSFDFSKDGWTYGPFAGLDGIDITSKAADGTGVNLNHQTESFTRYRMGAHVMRDLVFGQWTVQPGLSATWFNHQDNEASAATGEDANGLPFTPVSDRRAGTHPSAEARLVARCADGWQVKVGVWAVAGDDDRRQTAWSAGIAHRF
jgi:hypothetical protein